MEQERVAILITDKDTLVTELEELKEKLKEKATTEKQQNKKMEEQEAIMVLQKEEIRLLGIMIIQCSSIRYYNYCACVPAVLYMVGIYCVLSSLKLKIIIFLLSLVNVCSSIPSPINIPIL